jgi:membrane-bound lytic murein transglycosylase B
MMLRRDLLMLAFALASTRASSEDAASFHSFLDSVWRDAAARGLKRTTFDAAFAGASSDAAVLAAMRRQPEYGKPFGSYLASLVSPARIDAGARKSAQWVATLRAVEKKFGVEESILVSIWGIESSFGESEDRWDVFRSLATLAHAGFQHPFFGDELLSALKMLQEAHVPRRQFVGSWAGAMGQAQFLPSSYLAYAVDFDGDGYADIWRSVPDALASIANYLQKFGWRPGLPWGFEVTVPQRFDYRASRGTFHEWAQRRLSRADGGRFPDIGSAILFFPSGGGGPAFLVTGNFVVLKRTIPTPMRSRLQNFPTGSAGSPRSARRGRRTTSSLHAASASHCNADFQNWATRWKTSRAISISICATPCATSSRSSA